MGNLLTDEFSGPILVRNDEQRPILEHLEELRRRLLRCFLWVGLGTALCWSRAGFILALLIRPVGPVVYLSPVEPLMVHLKTAFLCGLMLGFPLVAWEVWGFFQPALRGPSRRPILLLTAASSVLFAAGAWFGWKGLLPAALTILQGFGGAEMTPMIAVGHYLSFAAWIVLGCGLIFQLPLGILAAVRAGWIRPATLVRQWRLAAVLLLAASAVLTPTPDIFTQLLLAAPLALLYGISTALSFGVAR